LPAARAACVKIFALRAKHAWPPPVIIIYQSWREPFAAMAAELRFYSADVEVAASGLRGLIAEIDAAR
jgi:hypothetical protein